MKWATKCLPLALAVGLASSGCGADIPEPSEVSPGESASSLLPGYQAVTAETPVGSSPGQQLIVDCPAGTKALGAGWSVLDGTGANLDGVATYSAPSWDGAQWMVNAKNLSSFAPSWKLRVRVLCATTLASYMVVPFETAASTAAFKQLQLSCPVGTKALGAGWGVLDGTDAILDGEALHFEPSYDGSSWLVNATHPSGGSWKLWGRLVCASTSSLPGYEVVPGETAVDGASWKQLQVACPAGKKALGAGWGVLDGTGAILDGAALHSEPSYNGSTWLTNASNSSAFAPAWKLRVRLLCL